MTARMNKNLIYLGVALALGLVASLTAVKYINQQVAIRTPVNNTRTTTVVVPVHPMEKGSILRQEDVSSREVPVDFVPADAVTPENYESFLGQMLRAPLAQGAPLGASAVELVADHFSNVIEKGKVAYTIQVDDTNAQSGLIVPGDHVDIQLLVSDTKSPRIMPLESDVLVLATGHRAKGLQNADSNGANGYNSVTLELPPHEAQRVAMAGKSGELRVMLRQSGNDQPFNLQALSKEDLLRAGNGHGHKGVEFIVGGS